MSNEQWTIRLAPKIANCLLRIADWPFASLRLPHSVFLIPHLLALSLLTLASGLSSAGAPVGELPLYFEVNQGQADDQIQFVARGRDQGIYLNAAGVVLALKADEAGKVRGGGIGTAAPTAPVGGGTGEARFVRVSLPGANPRASASGLEPLPGRVHYFLGNERSQWRESVPLFTRVRYEQVYAGIDLIYYGHDQQLEYDFVVAPGADASVIALRLEGADRLELDEHGGLVLHVGERQLRQHRPQVYQTVGGVRREIAGHYELRPAQTVAIVVGSYDPSQPLVIDPVLSYSTYIGGSKGDIGWGIAVGANSSRKS